MPDDEIAGVQAGQLPRSGALGWLGQLHSGELMAPGGEVAGEATVKAPAVGAHAHSVDAAAVTVQGELAYAHLAFEQLLAGADGDGVGSGVGGKHVQRL